MYLISIYFDEKTAKQFEGYMRQIAKRTGNDTMISEAIPPHLTISAFYEENEQKAREIFGNISSGISSGELVWAAAGAFMPDVLFLAPVLNGYLHRLSEISYKEVSLAGARPHSRYLPFQWMPHTTIAKRLTKEQMQIAFGVLQDQFSSISGRAVCVGLAKTNPYTDLEKIVLE